MVGEVPRFQSVLLTLHDFRVSLQRHGSLGLVRNRESNNAGHENLLCAASFGTLAIHNVYNLQSDYKESMLAPILYMRKLRPRELCNVLWFPKPVSHVSGSKPGLSAFKPRDSS